MAVFASGHSFKLTKGTRAVVTMTDDGIELKWEEDTGFGTYKETGDCFLMRSEQVTLINGAL